MGASRKSKGKLTFAVDALARNLWKNKRQVGNLPIFCCFGTLSPGGVDFLCPWKTDRTFLSRNGFPFERRRLEKPGALC